MTALSSTPFTANTQYPRNETSRGLIKLQDDPANMHPLEYICLTTADYKAAEQYSLRYNLNESAAQSFVRRVKQVLIAPVESQGEVTYSVLTSAVAYRVPVTLKWILLEMIWEHLSIEGHLSLIMNESLRSWAEERVHNSGDDINSEMVLALTSEVEFGEEFDEPLSFLEDDGADSLYDDFHDNVYPLT